MPCIDFSKDRAHWRKISNSAASLPWTHQRSTWKEYKVLQPASPRQGLCEETFPDLGGLPKRPQVSVSGANLVLDSTRTSDRYSGCQTMPQNWREGWSLPTIISRKRREAVERSLKPIDRTMIDAYSASKSLVSTSEQQNIRFMETRGLVETLNLRKQHSRRVLLQAGLTQLAPTY